jgi:hypothetical protein
MDVRIGKLTLGLFAPIVDVQDFKLFNLAEFGGSPFLEVPDFHAECDGPALIRGQLHLRLLRLSVTELNIVEAKDGRSNLVLSLDNLVPSGAPVNRDRETLLGLDFKGIDTLNLSLGRVNYSSVKRPWKKTEVKLGLKNEIITNVRSVAELKSLLVKLMFHHGITIAEAPEGAPRRANTRKDHPPPDARRNAPERPQ